MLIGHGTALKNGDSTVAQVVPAPGSEQAEDMSRKIDDLPDAKLADPGQKPPEVAPTDPPPGPGTDKVPTSPPETAPPTTPEAPSPAKDEPAPQAEEAGAPPVASDKEPAPPVGGGFPDPIQAVLSQCADLLASRSGKARDVCVVNITTYIERKKLPMQKLLELTQEQAGAVLSDVKIVVDVSAIQ